MLPLMIVGLTLTAAAQFQPLESDGPILYFIAEPGAVGGFESGDKTLAEWALKAWERAAEGSLRLRPATEDRALLVVHWVPATGGLYGEAMPFTKDGRSGAAIFVRPVTLGLGEQLSRLAKKDRLLRDTILYLTCLHELGHGLGLKHTDQYDDIMYFFGHGGDIPNYFMRYRKKLETRDDIHRHSGLSGADVKRLQQLYADRGLSR